MTWVSQRDGTCYPRASIWAPDSQRLVAPWAGCCDFWREAKRTSPAGPRKPPCSLQGKEAYSCRSCVARGAAMLAGVGVGIFQNHDSVPGPEYEPYTHRPAGDQAVYERLYSEVLRPLRERLQSPRPTQQTTGRSEEAV